MRYDVIVIGAGNGGLVSALTLQKAGKKVLILEKNNVPGGFVTSFVRGRFEFDTALHEFYGYGNDQTKEEIYELFTRLGIEEKLEMIPRNESLHVVTLNTHEEYTLPVSIQSFILKMEEYVSGSTESLNAFFRLALEAKKVFSYLNSEELETLKENNLEVLSFLNCSVEEVFEHLKMPKKAREILSTYWILFGSPMKELSFVHYAMTIFSYIQNGSSVPKLKSHDISLSLEEEFERLGGTIRFFSEVQKLFFQNDKVAGVTCNDGSVFYADYVISNIAPNVVYGSMIPLDHQQKEMNQLCNARTLGARGFSIYLGLNKSMQELGISHHHYFIFDALDSNIEAKKMKEIFHNGCVASVLENEANTTVLCITTLLFGEDFDKVVTSKNYFEWKEKIARHFISVFERASGSSIKETIEEIEVCTPVTFARYGGSPSGCIYGYQAKGYDNLIPRTLHVSKESYISNLFFCGGFGSRLSGFSSSYLNGEDVAKKLLEDMAKKGDI